MTDHAYKSLIDECLKEECDCAHYCLLKEIMLSAKKFDVRFLRQTKVIEIYKWHRGRKHKRDIGWAKAWEEWAEEDSNGNSYAKSFAWAYTTFPDLHSQALYEKVIEHYGKKPEDNP